MRLNATATALNPPARHSELPSTSAAPAQAPRPGLHTYTNAVMATGALLVAFYAPRTLDVDPVSFVGLLALAIVASLFKLNLRLSSGSATMTLGYAVGFIGLVTVGPHATAIAVSAGIWTQCAYRSGFSAPMDLRRRLFSVACGVITVEAAGWVFSIVGGRPGTLDWPLLFTALAAAALVYFVVNTALVAGAVALSAGQSVLEVWHKNFLLSAPSYFISAAIVGIGAFLVDRGAYLVALLIVGPLLLTYFAYRSYLGRIAEEQEQARLARDSEGTDGLTGLRNRVHLIDQIERSLTHDRAAASGQFAVLFLDLDGFKLVNDSLGHNMGDLLLQMAARRLEDSLRSSDLVVGTDRLRKPTRQTLARLGGDEFVVLLHNARGTSDAVSVAERLQATLSRPFDLDGRQVFLTASIGIALGPGAYRTPEEVLRDADIAMYRAKTLGKARAEVFDASMRARVLSRLQLDTDLRMAVERHEFMPYYQPIVDLTTGQLCGFEALLRWQHPERGVVEPAEFISIMEENRFVVPVGRRFVEQVCQQLSAWQNETPAARHLTVNINFAGQQFLDPALLDHLLARISGAGLEPHRIVLEITESTAIGTYARAVEVLERARDAGLRVVLDDFGTGYSSLSCLHELPISGIKLHRSFVTRKRRHPAILKAIVMLAGQLGLTVTAEGVETATQCEHLKRIGCDQAQGYLFARPMPAAQAGAFLRQPLPAPTRGDVLPTFDAPGPAKERAQASASILTMPPRKPASRLTNWHPSDDHVGFGKFIGVEYPGHFRGGRVALQARL
jgi:diguanylate cyclase (GGDEF)-like protein